MNEIQKMLKQEYQNSDTQNNSNNARKPKNDPITLNAKHPQCVRLVPYPDKPFWFKYRECWVDLHKGDGSTFGMPMIFPYTESKPDKLRDLLASIIKTNRNYNKKHKTNQDVIPVQYPSKTHPNYGARLSPRYVVQAVHLNNQGGNIEMETSGNMPVIRMMGMTTTAYHSLMERLNSAVPYKDANTKQPYPVKDFRHTGFVTCGETLALEFSKGEGRTDPYQVTGHEMDMVKPLPKGWDTIVNDDKNSGDHYKYMDNPAYIDAPTQEQEPQLYQKAYNELTKRYNKFRETNGENPYHADIADTARDVKKNVDNDTSSDPFSANATSESTSSIPFDTSSDTAKSESSSSSIESDSKSDTTTQSSSDDSIDKDLDDVDKLVNDVTKGDK